jgi:hypothetical protein
MQQATGNRQHATGIMQHATGNTQHATDNTQEPETAANMQQTTDKRHRANLPRAARTTQHATRNRATRNKRRCATSSLIAA